MGSCCNRNSHYSTANCTAVPVTVYRPSPVVMEARGSAAWHAVITSALPHKICLYLQLYTYKRTRFTKTVLFRLEMVTRGTNSRITICTTQICHGTNALRTLSTKRSDEGKTLGSFLHAVPSCRLSQALNSFITQHCQQSSMESDSQKFAPLPPDPVKPPLPYFKDPASHCWPGIHFTEHICLYLTIDFTNKRLNGRAIYKVRKLEKAEQLELDIRGIHIKSVTDPKGNNLSYTAKEDESPVGGILSIHIPTSKSPTTEFIVSYETDGCGGGSPAGGACDWLSPPQAGGQPFIFTQAQAIHARSIFPCQDTPAVKAPYTAIVSVLPPYQHLPVVMSAQRMPSASDDPVGSTRFHCAVPIPSYLFALACGSLNSRSLSPRCMVWAQPDVIDAASEEFADVENMLATAEELAGPYVWGRYDLLVLPASFPYGGMENPMLTFVTPTLIAVRFPLSIPNAGLPCELTVGNMISFAG